MMKSQNRSSSSKGNATHSVTAPSITPAIIESAFLKLEPLKILDSLLQLSVLV